MTREREMHASLGCCVALRVRAPGRVLFLSGRDEGTRSLLTFPRSLSHVRFPTFAFPRSLSPPAQTLPLSLLGQTFACPSPLTPDVRVHLEPVRSRVRNQQDAQARAKSSPASIALPAVRRAPYTPDTSRCARHPVPIRVPPTQHRASDAHVNVQDMQPKAPPPAGVRGGSGRALLCTACALLGLRRALDGDPPVTAGGQNTVVATTHGTATSCKRGAPSKRRTVRRTVRHTRPSRTRPRCFLSTA